MHGSGDVGTADKVFRLITSHRSAAMSDPPAPEGSGWKARRHRRRGRQRAALQAEASTHDPSDVAHFEKTARRYFREAIRERLRSDMHMPWDDDGAHGLRVVIDLGMQELMCDAERRSLVTQLQLSYADPLRLAVDAVEKAWEEEYRDTQDTRVSSEPLSYYSSQRDRAREKADAALSRFTRSPATRLLFSSLSGTFESILSNDSGSKRWAVRRSVKRFDEAVDELFSVARGAGPTGDLPLEASRTKTSSLVRADELESPSARRKPKSRDSIVVLSPDAEQTFPLNEPLDVSAIYVVGGLCDYKRVRGATLRRADETNVVAKRLPIEDALGTNASVNILTVNQTVQILSRVARNEGDWRLALIETLPERKLREMRARMEDVAKRRETGDDDEE